MPVMSVGLVVGTMAGAYLLLAAVGMWWLRGVRISIFVGGERPRTSDAARAMEAAQQQLQERVAQLERRLAQLSQGTMILADAVETGLEQHAAALERLRVAEAAPRPVFHAPVPDGASARIRQAAARGDSVAQIAAREALSIGEVRLRLALSSGERDVGLPSVRRSHASVRA